MGKHDRAGDQHGAPDQPSQFDVVFDDDFVARGKPEASIRRYQTPVSPPRPQVTARPARRQAARPAPVGPRDWSPQPERVSGLPDWASAPGRRARARRLRGALVFVAVLVAVGVVVSITLPRLTGGGPPLGAGGAPIAPIAPAHLPASAIPYAPPTGSATPRASDDSVSGLDPSWPVGSCFDYSAHIVLQRSCAQAHRYELVHYERADGPAARIPDDRYWQGPVARRCASDLAAFTGEPIGHWVADLASSEFTPAPDGWAAGDRTIYCVAEWVHPHTSGVPHPSAPVR